VRRRQLIVAILPLLCACTAGDGLPIPLGQAPGQPAPGGGVADMAYALPADLAVPPDLSAPPDLALPPTIQITIVETTGSGLSGDTTLMSFPLPTPTSPPIDGIGYLYQNLHNGLYDFTIAWQDTSNGNQGWTASFGGAPGVTPGWPIMSRQITISNAGSAFGPDKVAFVAGVGAQPNTLIITLRSVSNPQGDYGILRQGVRGQ
jgi:hypothetical protein